MQVYIWERCYLEHIDHISYEENGSKDEGKRHRQKTQTEHETDADEETSGSEEKRDWKRKRNGKKKQATIPTTTLSIY